MARVSVLKKKAEVALKKGRIAEAGKLYKQVCAQAPADLDSVLKLGAIKNKQGLYTDALNYFQTVMQKKPQNHDAHAGFGEASYQMGRFLDSRKHCEYALKINPQNSAASYTLANVFREQSAFDAAEKYYALTVQLDPDHANAHYYLGNMQKTQGRVDDSIKSYDTALQLAPTLIEALWSRAKILPVIISTTEQLKSSRTWYKQGIESLANNLHLETKAGKRNALRGLLTNTNFYLQYQGRDDLELQCIYGNMLTEIMASNYPQWSKSLDKVPLKTGDKIKIGYVTAFLRAHNGAVWLLGWLKNRNRDDFEIHCYHTGTAKDEKTTEFINACDHFHHIPGNIEKLCKKIVDDQLHVLVYPELGMDSQSMLTAGLRLAPIQCVGWGHPITSGLSTMDYWLSSDLMEPENGQEHYSEKLIRLPNLANCHSIEQHDRLQREPLTKCRTDFGLPEDAVLYFCSQSLFKYLPQYDYLWPEIAKKVPDAKFVFLAISSVHVLKKFMARIEKAFNNYNLRAQDYCIMLNRQTPEDYLTLNKLVDVFLDNPPWSGNNTSMAAIDAHLPIISYPTGFMRGRHSYAILTMIDLHETIADSEEEYIELAVRAGCDVEWRSSIVKKIINNHTKIYNDTDCVKGLEEFYRSCVQ